jgi:aconitate hydratase
MARNADPFGAREVLKTRSGAFTIWSLRSLEKRGLAELSVMPYVIRILLEQALRQVDGFAVREQDVRTLCQWNRKGSREFPFKPGRVIMQDFTGVPAIVDLAAMRDAMAELGGDPGRINPVIPVDLVIDHSVQVDRFATAGALAANAELEFARNRERYEFLRWGAKSFAGFRVVPPATGIVHQVNLEYLARVVMTRERAEGGRAAFPDTLVGTDSHTTMINGIGVLGWGVGGIEAEAALLGQPLYMRVPEVVGFRLSGQIPSGVTATDLVLTLTQILRQHGVVDKIVEFFGPGLNALSVADRATIGNMSPEFGATAGFFPVDRQTLQYLAFTGRSAEQVELVERYCREQGLFRQEDDPQPQYASVLELELGSVEPSLAGPRRPQDRLPLGRVKGSWRADGAPQATGAPQAAGGSPDASSGTGSGGSDGANVQVAGQNVRLKDGDVVIAAVTSCTNTSNPAVMLAAGLLARKAVRLGLQVPAWVKTSLAPGSRVVTRYLERAGLAPYLEALGFHLVGYGCTTCIGNSGPLHPAISRAIQEKGLNVAAVLSGNRNFEGRIHPEVRSNYLASPPLVVAYALAGTMELDLASEPIGLDRNEQPVYLKDLWPSPAEVQEAIRSCLSPEMFRAEYADVFEGNETWNRVQVRQAPSFQWSESSTYIRRPPFFEGLAREAGEPKAIRGARVLAWLGDSVTTDHISPAGSISAAGPAGRWLLAHGVPRGEFNSYGSRRGNHEVMIRGTFANIRIRNRLVPGVEGGFTRHLPSGQRMYIAEAAERYAAEGVSLVVLAGKEYGSGSSRDWAAKGTLLLGVRAVIAESFERIHRSNLLGMGVLPLQFRAGESAASLGLSGEELFDLDPPDRPAQELEVVARAADGGLKRFRVLARVDTAVELEYLRHGGILPAVLRGFLSKAGE